MYPLFIRNSNSPECPLFYLATLPGSLCHQTWLDGHEAAWPRSGTELDSALPLTPLGMWPGRTFCRRRGGLKGAGICRSPTHLVLRLTLPAPWRVETISSLSHLMGLRPTEVKEFVGFQVPGAGFHPGALNFGAMSCPPLAAVSLPLPKGVQHTLRLMDLLQHTQGFSILELSFHVNQKL